MEIPRQRYTEEFKQEAVKLVIESGLSIAKSGRRLNISAMTLKNWPSLNTASLVSISDDPPTLFSVLRELE